MLSVKMAARSTCSSNLSKSSLSILRRHYSDSPSDFDRPAPPSLPPEQQREFEELVRKANAPLAFETDGDVSEQKHPDLRRKVEPQFEGKKNPFTGEVNGPKVEPLRHGDWSFGGRATDF